MGYVTPPFFCQEATVHLEISLVFRVISENQQGTDSKGTGRDTLEKRRSAVHTFRTVESNLIAFEVDDMFTRNLFS